MSYETVSAKTFNWELDDIIKNCETLIMRESMSNSCRLEQLSAVLESRHSSPARKHEVLKELCREWNIFGVDFLEMQHVYAEGREFFVIVESEDVPVLCCLTEKDVFNFKKKDEEDVQDFCV